MFHLINKIRRNNVNRLLMKGACVFVIGLLLFAAVRCIEPFELEGVSSNPDLLVVDGFINVTEGKVTVRLTKALGVQSEEGYTVVTGADVKIISEDGTEFPLQWGHYTDPPEYQALYYAEGISVDHGKKYKLWINAGEIYESEFVEIQVAAPIQSIEYEAHDEDLRIYVNSAESPEASQYYRWRYEETFEYNAPLYSSWYMDENREMIYRPTDESVYICYRQDPSNEILVSSSTELSTNVIRNREIRRLPRESIRISRLYSLNVKQMALTEEAYTYWLNLYKTTENTGGLFDPLPGQVYGNIKCVSDPELKVVGFFSGSTIEQKRLWIDRSDLPRGFAVYRPAYCEQDTISVADLQFRSPGSIFGQSIMDMFGNVSGYTYSSVSCLDCRYYLSGGTTTKPEFWP